MRLGTAWILAAFLALCAVPGAMAQVITKPFRIYAITFRGMTDVEKGFQDYFAARGIPVEITYRDLARDDSRIPGFLEEIRSLKPDLIYTWGTSVTVGIVGPYDKVEAKHISDIPVIFTMVAAPVAAKIAPDLKSSKRNVTGVYNVASAEAQFQAMHSYRPTKSIGMIYTPTERNSVIFVEQLQELAKKRGLSVVAKPFKLDAGNKATNEGAAEMVREMKKQGVDWLYLPPDSFLNTQAKSLIIPVAMENGLATFASTEGLMANGALLGLVANYHALGQFTAYKAEQVLVGRVAAGKIPIETLTRFSLVVRMEAARALGMPPPLPMFNYAEMIPVPTPKIARE